jgi:probable rRNA maturation factor
MAVLIDNRQKTHRLKMKRIKRTAQVVLNALDCPDGELSILLVDNSHIAELNEQYLDRIGPTNVIAFPMRAGEFADLAPDLLGDVVISLDTADSEARAAGIDLERRFRELLVHGILHLFGYDHETNDADARRMEDKSTELLALIAQMDPN